MEYLVLHGQTSREAVWFCHNCHSTTPRQEGDGDCPTFCECCDADQSEIAPGVIESTTIVNFKENQDV